MSAGTPLLAPGKASKLLFVALPRWIMGSALLIGLAINLANVIGRYAFGYSLYWAEEVLVYLMIWGVFIGVAAVAFNGDHLNMDLFSSGMNEPWKTIINACIAYVALRTRKNVCRNMHSRYFSGNTYACTHCFSRTA